MNCTVHLKNYLSRLYKKNDRGCNKFAKRRALLDVRLEMVSIIMDRDSAGEEDLCLHMIYGRYFLTSWYRPDQTGCYSSEARNYSSTECFMLVHW